MKPGRFELADRGTLFLDEVGELPRDMQVKLLRVIQDHEFERVGGLKTIKVDVRLIAATNRNLSQDVRDGKFREDLFYRLNVFPIHLPPLRERKDDIANLCEFILAKFNKKLEKNVGAIEPGVFELFTNYEWPGNIRELENILERLVLTAGSDRIKTVDVAVELGNLLPTQVGNNQNMEKSFKDVIKGRMEDVEKQMIEIDTG